MTGGPGLCPTCDGHGIANASASTICDGDDGPASEIESESVVISSDGGAARGQQEAMRGGKRAASRVQCR